MTCADPMQASLIRPKLVKPRRVIANVEWHPGELYPRVGMIVTNMSRAAENVVAFYNKRGTCEQWIKEGKGAIGWTRLLCRSFAANAVRLQLHALAYNLGNFLRTLATPEPIEDWSLTVEDQCNRFLNAVVCGAPGKPRPPMRHRTAARHGVAPVYSVLCAIPWSTRRAWSFRL